MTPKETRSALVVLALLLPCLGALVWSARLAGGVDRPGALRGFASGGEERVAFVFAHALHLLDAQGRRLARQPLAELGLAEEPTDMDWTVDAAGKVQAWFFEDTAPRLVRCDLDPAAARLRACATVLSGRGLKHVAASSAVHIAVDLPRNRVFIADAKGHAVRAMSLQGRQLADSARGELFFPNRLRLAGDQLVVADNDRHRLVWLDVAADPPSFAPGRVVAVPAHPDALPGRKAADFALRAGADGTLSTLWLLAVAQGQKHGQVLVYGPGLAPRGQAQLGGYGDPLIVERLGDALLAADFEGIALYRVGADGRFLGEFGAGAFAQELAAARAQLRAATWWRYGGWAGLALALLVGFALAWRFSEKPGARQLRAAFGTLDASQAAVPLEPLELRPAAGHAWRTAAVPVASLALLAGAFAGLAWSLRHEIPPGLLGAKGQLLLILLLLFLLGAMVAVAWAGWRLGRRSLWLGQGRIEVRLDGRTLATATPAQLLATPRALLVGPHVLPYRASRLDGKPGRWVFDEYQFKRYVLAHLAAAQRLTDPELARARLRRTPPWQLALVFAPVLAYLAYALWQGLR